MNIYLKHKNELTEEDFDKFGFALKRIDIDRTLKFSDEVKIVYYTQKALRNLECYYGEKIPNNYQIYSINIPKEYDMDEIKKLIVGKDVLEITKMFLEILPNQAFSIVKKVPTVVVLDCNNMDEIINCLPDDKDTRESCLEILKTKRRAANQVSHLL